MDINYLRENYETPWLLPEDNGKSAKSPIASLLNTLEDDNTITDKQRAYYAIRLANYINISRADYKDQISMLTTKLDMITLYLFGEGDMQIRKLKEILFSIPNKDNQDKEKE